MKREKNAVTLLELILAITFLSVIVLGINSIYYFSHFQTVNTERRAWLQNQLSLTVEHMRREIGKAIGNEALYTANSVIDTSNIAGQTAIKVYVDSGAALAGAGTPDVIYAAGDGQRGSLTDRTIAYRWTGAGGAPVTRYQVQFCPKCANAPCAACNPAWVTAQNIVGKNIAAFTVGSLAGAAFVPGKPGAPGPLNDNSIAVQITTCWDPAIAENVDNPCLTTTTLITMPSVTAH